MPLTVLGGVCLNTTSACRTSHLISSKSTSSSPHRSPSFNSATAWLLPYSSLTGSLAPSAHASSYGRPPWHLCLVLGSAVVSIDSLDFICFFITSFSAPQEGILADKWDPEHWLAAQDEDFRVMHIPIPAIMDSAGVASK